MTLVLTPARAMQRLSATDHDDEAGLECYEWSSMLPTGLMSKKLGDAAELFQREKRVKNRRSTLHTS